MTDAIPAFFSAWSISDDAERSAVLTGCLADTVSYADPRAPQIMTGIDALNGYLAMFSASAPGMEASVVNLNTIQGTHRATVSFGMPGSDQAQLGQYFVELDDTGKIARMVGFVGLGAPE